MIVEALGIDDIIVKLTKIRYWRYYEKLLSAWLIKYERKDMRNR